MQIPYRLVRVRDPKSGRIMVRPIPLKQRTLEGDSLAAYCGKGTGVSWGTVLAALDWMATVLRWSLSNGESVRFPGVGRFSPQILYRAAEEGRFEPRRHIKGLRIHFQPEGALAGIGGRSGAFGMPRKSQRHDTAAGRTRPRRNSGTAGTRTSGRK